MISTPHNIGAIVLAAGTASRFGAAKQLLVIDGEKLIDRAVRIAREYGCKPVVRVLGAHASEIIEQSKAGECVTVFNPLWHTGMGGSIATGVTEILRLDPLCEAVFILLADQPMIEGPDMEKMWSALASNQFSIVLINSGESLGPPALFLKRHFADLQKLSGDRGAKAIATVHPSHVATVNLPDAIWDIDSPEKWAELRRHLEEVNQTSS